MNWYVKKYDDLELDQLYDILALRISVFVIEQNCPYQENDGKDKKAVHLFAVNDKNEYCACSRILPPGISYKESSIGRVVVSSSYRKTGIGHELMQRSIDVIEQNWGKTGIRISAQQYLENFYSKHGFVTQKGPYMEDNIPHLEMLRV
jgi:ElaA protein